MTWRHTQRLALEVVIFAATCSASADELLQHSGRCQSLTVLDRNIAGKCQDKMIEQVGSVGERGFLFRTDDGATVFFVALDKPPAPDGSRTMPLSRIEFGLRAQLEGVQVLDGSCVSVDPKATFRAETSCEAATLKGSFTVRFVTIDGAVESLGGRR